MKIKDMTTKTSLEVEDTDLLVIEDGEDTKSITVGEFKKLLNLSSDANVQKTVKTIVNETLDNITASLQAAKYVMTELQVYTMYSWIDSTTGEIQIAFKDNGTDTWLTADDIVALKAPSGEEGTATYYFTIEAKIADAYQIAVSYSVRDYNEAYPNADIAELANNNAGFIQAQFSNLTQNEIAGVTYDDIKVSFPASEERQYIFSGNEEFFSNSIPYIEEI